jgi:peroxiredoxin
VKRGFPKVGFSGEKLPVCLFLLIFFLGFSSSSSSAFAFRTLEIGKKVPEIHLKDIDGKEFLLSSIKAKKTVILFWGADTTVKEKRSLGVMGRIENLYRRFKEEGLDFVSVISDLDAKEKVKILRQKASWSHHVLIDEKREVYGTWGVYIIPTVGILDEEGRLLKAIPFTHSLEEDVEGGVLVALGKKTAEELEKERHPKEILPPENKRKAQSHFSLGKNHLDKGLLEKAREEFSKAVQFDPDYGDAHIGLGMILLREKKPREAIPLFEKGNGISPFSKQGGVGLALALEALGEKIKAIEKLEAQVKAQRGTSEVHYHLGRLYENEGRKDKALIEYKKSLQFFFKEE